MKTVKLMVSLFAVGCCLALGSCAKDGAIGPAGKDGKDGVDGTDGTDGAKGNNGTNGKNGNANVRMYKFAAGPYDFSSEKIFDCPSTTDSSQKSVWNVYIGNGTFTYQLPGYGPGGSNFYRSYFNTVDFPTLNKVYIGRKTGTVTESFSEVKIFRIYANVGGKGVTNIYNGYTADEVRNMDYVTFVKAFNIEE